MDSQGHTSIDVTAPPLAQSPVAPVIPLQSSPVPSATPAYSQPQAQSTPPVYQPNPPRRSGTHLPQTPSSTPYQVAPASHQYSPAPASPYAPYQANRLAVPPAVYNPNAPRPIEVFHLSDTANAAIPADIRAQFHCNDQGHVLFFSSPPLDVVPPAQKVLSHSLKYLAARDERRKRVEQRKRRKSSEQEQREEHVKRIRADEETALAARVESLATMAVEIMTNEILAGTNELYEILYKDRADEVRRADTEGLDHRILASRLSEEQVRRIRSQSNTATLVNLKGNAIYMDDVDLES